MMCLCCVCVLACVARLCCVGGDGSKNEKNEVCNFKKKKNPRENLPPYSKTF